MILRMSASGGDWSKCEKDLQRLVNFNFKGLHVEIGEYILDSTKERFRKGISPTGEAWKPSIRAKETGGKTMMDTRRLYNSLTYRATMDGVEVGTNVKYAETHQPKDDRAETEITPKKAKALKFRINGKWVTKKKVRIPRRDFLGLSNDDLQEIDQINEERIGECFK